MHQSRRLAAIRSVFIVLFLTTLSHAVYAQEVKMLRVGRVGFQSPTMLPVSAFLKRMTELGYIQGKNFVFESVQVSSFADYDRAYHELATRKLDIMLATGPEIALKSALSVAGPLPIVMIAVDYDPLARGYVSNLARPDGNVTGVFFRQVELTKKRLQLMQEAFPDMKRITVFWDRVSADQWRAAQSAAALLGVHVHGVEFHDPPYDFERAWAQIAPEQRGGLMVLASPLFKLPQRRRLTDFARRHRIPNMFSFGAYVKAGGLMSYGASFTDIYRRAAEYVDRIAKGAKPAELPIEQPTNFDLVINLKTAKALGITLPPAFLFQANEVIQ